MLFTDCDEDELLLIEVKVEEEIQHQALLREPPQHHCPPVSLIDSSSFTSPTPSSATMSTGKDEFDIQAAYRQITGGCYIRLKRCDSDNYSPALKKSKLNRDDSSSVANHAGNCVIPSLYDDDNDEPSTANGIKPVRTEVSHSALCDKLKNVYRNTVSLSLSEETLEESEKRVAKKQTSRKSTYRPSLEIDQRMKETLQRVRFKTEKKRKRRHSSPHTSRKKSLKHRLQEEYKSHKTIHLSSKVLAEGSSSSDEDRFDIKPRFEIPTAPPAIVTDSSSASIKTESNPDLQPISKSSAAVSSMPSLDELENSFLEVKENSFEPQIEKSPRVTLPVTINSSARPSVKLEENRPPENEIEKMPNFPNLGPSISVSLVPPVVKRSKPSSRKIKSEPIDLTEDDDTPCRKPITEPDKSKIGLIKVRTPYELGVMDPLKSFAVGMSKLCNLPSHLSTVSVIADEASDILSTCTDAPRDPRLANKSSAPTSSSKSTQSSVIRSPVMQTKSGSPSNSDPILKTTVVNNTMQSPLIRSPVEQTELATPSNSDPVLNTTVVNNTTQSSLIRPTVAKTELASISNSRPVMKPTSENNSMQSSVVPPAVAQTSFTSPTSNSPSVSHPSVRSSVSDGTIQSLKNKIDEDLRNLSVKLSEIFKEYLKKNLSQKKKSSYEAENFDAFRNSVSNFLRCVSKYAGQEKKRFEDHVRYNFVKLLRYAVPKRALNVDESSTFMKLMHHDIMNRWFQQSLVHAVLGERAAQIENANQSQMRANILNINKPESQSTSPIVNQPVLNATNHRPNGNELPNPSGSDLKNQQNRYSCESANSQETPLQSMKNNLQNSSLVQQQHSHVQLQSVTSPPISIAQLTSSPLQNTSRANVSQARCSTSSNFPAAIQSRPSPPSVPTLQNSVGLHQNNYAFQQEVANTYLPNSLPHTQEQTQSMPVQRMHDEQIRLAQYPTTFPSGQIRHAQYPNTSPSIIANSVPNAPSTVVPLDRYNCPSAGMTVPSHNESAQRYTFIMEESTEYVNCSNNRIYPQPVNAATRQLSYNGQYPLLPQYSQLPQYPVQYQQHLRLQQTQLLQPSMQLQQTPVHQQPMPLQQTQVIQQPIHVQQTQIIQQQIQQQPYLQHQFSQPYYCQTSNFPSPLSNLESMTLQHQQPFQIAADNRAFPAPVSVPLVNSSQSPSPSYSAGTTPINNQQPVSVNFVQSTSGTPPERNLTETDPRSCKDVDTDYDMYKKCTEMLKEFYQVTSNQF